MSAVHPRFDSTHQEMKKLLSLFALSFAVLGAAPTPPATEKAVPPAPDVSGTWNLVVEFGGGGGTPVFTFKQAGENLTGHYRGAFGEAEVTGTIKDHEIKFGFKIAGQDESVTYAGTVDGDSMKGRVVLGSYGEGTFTGKRQAKP
jgi:hypothetical protein